VPPWACLPGWRLGPLHRVLPRIWPYLDKNQKWSDPEKYSAMPITLAHNEILINDFCGLIVIRCRCELRYRASKLRNARASYWHILTYPFWIVLPLVVTG
jgi:hypothetical protein